MASLAADSQSKFGQARYVVDAADLTTAREMGLLREGVKVESDDSLSADYGVAYDRQNNIADNSFASQKLACACCKSFAFFNRETPFDRLECPFYINAFGQDGEWKITKANFAHSHVKYIGLTEVPCVEGSITRPDWAKRNTTQEVEKLTALVESEMLPAHNSSTVSLTGKAIQTFLRSKGADVSRSRVSRMKLEIDNRLQGDLVESYQKLQSYLELMAGKNPGSVWRLDKARDGMAFERACFIPNVGIHIVKMSKQLIGFDGAHLKGDMNKRGIVLVATAKDYNNHVVPFAFGLVRVEDYDNWCWFMTCVKFATGLTHLTVVSDRQKGLLSAVAEVFPEAGHRFCLRHIMDSINRICSKLSNEERGSICQLARSDCQNEYDLFRSELAESKPEAAEYLDKIDQKHWVKFKFREAFNLPTYNEITSNLSEQANNWMGTELRSAKPLDAISLYFRKLSELTSEKRQMAANWSRTCADSDLVPVLLRQRTDRSTAASMCAITPHMGGAYSAQHLGSQSCQGQSIHDLPASECTCGKWQDQAFPCIHAICAATKDGRRLDDLYDAQRMSISHFQATYTFAFKPWPTNVTLAVDAEMRIPEFEAEPERVGKRGLKPRPKPKHNRKQAKNVL
ncbi:hypothetical protein PC110_g19901 [Phytophthora cactorum]|uniref:SWIM-type domain-containing protein n=1 Tax=Phytophthora cactorum TaxID=29920 RepID=A0A329RH27_9STRA|nr:hypothetical protein PC110_g19901 [Phytophthora cactorum]